MLLLLSLGTYTSIDMVNTDNLLFSCCCARVGPTWSPVCGCYSGSYKCDQECVEQALIEDSLFYPVGVVGLFIEVFTEVLIKGHDRTSTTTYPTCIPMRTSGLPVRNFIVRYYLITLRPRRRRTLAWGLARRAPWSDIWSTDRCF